MKRKLGINAHCLNGVTELEALPLIKAAGFESVFIASYQAEPVKALKEKTNELGLELEFIHAPFKGINNLWLPGDDYLGLYNKLIETIDAAGDNDIPKVILHLSSSWTPPAICDLGMARYDALVQRAKEKGVVLAVENLRVVGNVAYFVDHYANENTVRFCYDCGHEHCYTKTVSWLDIFTNKVCCTHIHDNMSRDLWDKDCNPDTHLLPFDGTFDYAQMIRKMDTYGYTGNLTLEVTRSKDEYKHMSNEEFLQTCYERLLRISKM